MRFASPVVLLALFLSAAPGRAEIPGPTVLVADGTPIAIGRDVQLRLRPGAAFGEIHSTQLALGKAGARIPVLTIPVHRGHADVSVPGKAQQRGAMFQVGTKISAVTSGGRVGIHVTDDEVAIAVYEGDALIGFEGRFKPLKGGSIRRIQAKTGYYTDVPFLSAPVVQGKPKLAGSLEGPVVVPLPTQAVSQAKRYVVRLFDAETNELAQTSEIDRVDQLSVTVPHAGKYEAEVVAVDASDFESAPSPRVPLRILGLAPGQNLVQDGSIYLEPGQRAQILGTEGLIMRYGSSTEYVPAAPSVGLSDQRATSVEYRDPADPESLVIVPLQPQLLRTKMNFGSAKTEWPKDKVPITVNLWNIDGTPVKDVSEYVVAVTVNLREIPLVWARNEGTIQAVLEPQPGPGPWVVRAHLRNPRGIEVARDFLEVTQTKVKVPVEMQAMR